MTETTAPAAPEAEATPADLTAAAIMTWRGAVMTADQAREIGDLLSEFEDTGDGTAIRHLSAYWAGRTAEVIAFRQATGDLPASVLDLGPVIDSVLIDAMIDAGVPAPDCEAAEALVSAVMELVIRRLCAERAGLCAGGLNRILSMLDPAEPDQARLADRIADLLGGDVAAPGGIGFTVE